jgi:hypothetical protein
MYNAVVRPLCAALIVFSIWASALVSLPAPALAQDKPAEKPEQEKSGSDKKAKKSQTKKAAPASATRGLSTKEDPSQIGKRKINGGTDKLFGWLGGSQEKEMQIGRQLALQVASEGFISSNLDKSFPLRFQASS